MTTGTLGGVGVWSMDLRYGDAAEIPDAAAELEALGYTALWVPDVGGPTFYALDVLLRATTTVTVAAGILNIWNHTAQDVADWWHALPEHSRDRVLLGVGISHGPVIGDRWQRPLAIMAAYLDDLEAAGVPLAQVCVAALGPKMLELAKNRTAGAHPYFVPPVHTADARAAAGDSMLAVEQGVVLDSDLDRARDRARPMVTSYGTLPNYANNWKRLGFTDDDILTGSDRLVDALIACGDESDIEQRIKAQFQAGADHVCIQVVTRPGEPLPRDAWRRLAPR
jgi:probable F420-dependent oxidoreductase